ncbi:MAG: type II secretion system F family protein [Idiomarina sp.]|nr:type II secretion system F family protein [Idiomarina sp.]
MQASWYRYEARARHEQETVQRGVRKAQSLQTLRIQLWHRGNELLSAVPLRRSRSGSLAQLAVWQQWFHTWSELLNAGFDMHRALSFLHQQSLCHCTANLSHALLIGIERGESLASRLKAHGPLLLQRYVSALQSAEEIGQLPAALANLALELQERVAQRRALYAALSYPSTVLVLGIFLWLAMKLAVLPRFATMYADAQAELPWITAWLLQPAAGMGTGFLACLTALLGGVLLLWKWWPVLRTSHMKARIMAWLVRQPWWPMGANGEDYYRLGLSLTQGFTLQQGVTLVAKYHSCPFSRQRWYQSLHQLNLGRSATQLFRHHPLNSAQQGLLELGERSGTLPKQLMSVAAQLKFALSMRQARFAQQLPTLVLVVISLCAAVFMVALYLPLFQLGLAVS